jgi:uncharacterized surface protein with fasciclin (FAS1) repeats
MSDVPGPNDGHLNDPLAPSADPSLPPSDPTMVMPVTPGLQAAAAATTAGAQFDEYQVVDQPWYRKPGPQMGVAIGALLLLSIGGFLLLSSDSDSVVSTDVNDSVQLEIARITRTEEAVPATLTATVTGPTSRPAEYQWILPAGAEAPQPAVGVTDATGRLKFAWAPIAAPADDSAWSSTVMIEEVLPPNATLAATSFECVLERDDVTLNVTIVADVSPEGVTEPRTVRYTFGGIEFVTGDSVTCPILNGDPNTETTTTTLPATTTVPTSTVAPTTLPPTTLAPAPEVTTTTTAATTTTTVAAKTTVISVIDGRTDLSTFSNLIDRAGLREQLARQDEIFTVVAPNNAAIEALLASPNPPNLNDQVAARDFVLAHVKTGQVLNRSDIAAQPGITFDVGPEQVVDATVSPITIGGAAVIDADATAELGVVHTLDRTLVTPAP